MIFPSRATSYKSSVIPKMVITMNFLSQNNYKPDKLFQLMENNVTDVGEFLDVMDCLYLLGEIDITSNGEVTSFVKRDNNIRK